MLSCFSLLGPSAVVVVISGQVGIFTMDCVSYLLVGLLVPGGGAAYHLIGYGLCISVASFRGAQKSLLQSSVVAAAGHLTALCLPFL